MIEKYTIEEFYNASAKDTLPLECTKCGEIFLKTKREIRRTRIDNDYCSKKCKGNSKKKTTTVEVECKHCSKKFQKNQWAVKRTLNHFCSKSCAAKHNNVISPKRKKLGLCKKCGGSAYSDDAYCKPCWKQIKEELWDPTLEELSLRAKDKGNRYGLVRHRSRLIAREKVPDDKYKCSVCGLKNPLEVAHIIEISKSPKEFRISEVNRLENLSLLCRNHHWEFDKGSTLPRSKILSIQELLEQADVKTG